MPPTRFRDHLISSFLRKFGYEPHQSYLIRVLTARDNDWLSGGRGGAEVVAPRDLARITFADDNLPVSVFIADNDHEELDVAAAFALPRNASIRKPTYILRVPANLIQEHEINADPSDGDTGVRRVDERHRDLYATIEQYAALTEHLLSRQYDGEDLVRVIKGSVLTRRLETFLGFPESEITPKARQQIRKMIGPKNQ